MGRRDGRGFNPCSIGLRFEAAQSLLRPLSAGAVSILVLLDCALKPVVFLEKHHGNRCFNPCSIGLRFEARLRSGIGRCRLHVSILVLLDCALKPSKSNSV